MANFTGSTAQAIPRSGSLVQWDDPVQLPLGLASVARNTRYRAESQGTRWGFSRRLQVEAAGRLTGMGLVRYIAEDTTGDEHINMLIYAAATGNLYSAVPFVQSSVTKLTTTGFLAASNLALAPNLFPVIAQAFNKNYVAMGNLSRGIADNLVFNPATGNLDPLSDKPFGAPWTPNTRCRTGQMLCPSVFKDNGSGTGGGNWIPKPNGHLFQVTNNGTTGTVQPTWPTTPGGTVNDNGIVMAELTPQAYSGLPNTLAPTGAAAPGSSVIADGATVFIVLTYNSAQGESAPDLTKPDGTLNTGSVLEYTNTTGAPVILSVTLPAIPPAVGTGGTFGPTQGASSYNVYTYIVTGGAADIVRFTDPSFYAQVAGGPFAPGTVVPISAFPTGQVLPAINTATVVPAGNVDTGVRYMIVFFMNRNGYITGCSTAVPVRVEVTAAGFRLEATPIPTGPYNTRARICAFTIAGQSSTGPYFWIPEDDVESPGSGEPDVPITATIIEDNTTVTRVFNFTDTYLTGGLDVSNYFDRQEVQPASDVYFSEELSMVMYTGCADFPSGHLVSDLQDPEAVRVPGSNLQVAESNGDRTVCWRELRDIQLSIKENGGYVVIPNAGDPTTWGVQPLWKKRGPVSAKAIDIYSSDDSDFVVFAHKDGLCRVTGTAAPIISRELELVWKRINWAAAQQIVVKIDGAREEVRVSVPIDGATSNNLTITVNYHYGWGDPVIFAVRSGRLVPNVEGRKWSLDDLAHADLAYVPQRYGANAAAEGADLAENLIAAGYDGAIYTLTENQYHDQNYAGQPVGYFYNWESVPGPSARLDQVQLNGATIGGKGAGSLNVYARDTNGKRVALSKPDRPCMMGATETERDLFAQNYSTRFGIGFDNGGVPDVWAEIHTAILWVRPWAKGRQA